MLVLCTALLSTQARASGAASHPQEVPEGAAPAPLRSQPSAFALGPSLGALGGGVLFGLPGGVFFVGSAIASGSPNYGMLALPVLGPTAGVVLGDLLSGHAPVGAWGGALLGGAVGTAGSIALMYGGQPAMGLGSLALLPPLGAVLGRALVLGLTGEPSPVAARKSPSVVWSLVPARLGTTGTGAVVAGWF